MVVIEAVRKVLKENPSMRESEKTWGFFVKVLNEMGFFCYITFKKNIPSPESILRARRIVLNERNEFPKDFIPEPGVTYIPKGYKNDENI